MAVPMFVSSHHDLLHILSLTRTAVSHFTLVSPAEFTIAVNFSKDRVLDGHTGSVRLLFTLIISAASVISFAAAALTVSPGVVSSVPAFDIPVATNVNASQAQEQEEACKAADPSKIYAAIRCESGPPDTVGYTQCVPFQNQKGEDITSAVYCQSANCNFFSDAGCKSKPTNLTPAPFTPGPHFSVVSSWQIVGYRAFNCTSNVVPRLP
ncbi:unnamed protein product [Cyclocybe aegerita]|uniref:Uncharacterized protein n=1 Tax=Cyclocybe aegerita TaxID=1973307 RepID=A0A8S0WQ56_CYCAE|nr:unnamed protein product [Cyclocybe aegerita]